MDKKKFWEWIDCAILFISSSFMIGIGLRFVGTRTDTIYIVNRFDQFLDWGGLLLFGSFLFIYSVRMFYGWIQKYRSVEKEC